MLQATEPVTLLVLDDDAIRGLAVSHPEIAAALEGTTPRTIGPAGGTRLSRMTIGVSPPCRRSSPWGPRWARRRPTTCDA